jgi:uncharacterized damage-inducible protein DinB
MISREHARTMAAYNRWMNERLYELCASLSDSERKRDRVIEDWAERVDERWLAEDFTYTSRIDGRTRTLPAWLLVAHMFNHQAHHRGQLTTLLSQLGVDPGVTDLPWLPALTSGRGSSSPAP